MILEIEELFLNKTLSADKAGALLTAIAENRVDPNLVAAFLTVFRMRQLSVSELAGFRGAMLQLARRVDLSEYDPIDLCGTGGDGKNTFNISTASAFLVAACGVPVAKHGNYGMSSRCGSSNVLEALGVEFASEESQLKVQLRQANICFLHAPLFHPAMKNIAPVRKALGFRTFFNLIGPLVNPARPRKQLVGVSTLASARLYTYLLQQESINFTVVHALDGYDEISLTGPVKVIANQSERLFSPHDLGLPQVNPAALRGGDSPQAGALILTTILQGRGSSEQSAVVAANAGLALHLATPERSLVDSIQYAMATLLKGKAYEILQLLRECQLK